jgi:hypothetical protein
MSNVIATVFRPPGVLEGGYKHRPRAAGEREARRRVNDVADAVAFLLTSYARRRASARRAT